MLDLLSQTTAGLDQFRRQWEQLLGAAANDPLPSRLAR